MTPTEIVELVEKALREGKRKTARRILLIELRSIEKRIERIENALLSNFAVTTIVELAIALTGRPVQVVITVGLLLLTALVMGLLALRRLERKRSILLRLLVEIEEDCDEEKSNKHDCNSSNRMNEYALYILISTIIIIIVAIIISIW